MSNNTQNEDYDKVSRQIAINFLDILNTRIIAEKCGVPLEEVNMFEKAYKKGKEEVQLEIAKSFMGILNVELIASKCGISVEKVNELKREYENNINKKL